MGLVTKMNTRLHLVPIYQQKQLHCLLTIRIYRFLVNQPELVL